MVCIDNAHILDHSQWYYNSEMSSFQGGREEGGEGGWYIVIISQSVNIQSCYYLDSFEKLNDYKSSGTIKLSQDEVS